MLSDATYRQWTTAFNPGSYFKGSWDEGSKILFLGPNPDGNGEGGMTSRIVKNRLHEFVSIEHLGMINNGVEDTTSDAVKQWTSAFENYTFRESAGATELLIDIDVPDDYKIMFEDMWPRALQSLKELAEK